MKAKEKSEMGIPLAGRRWVGSLETRSWNQKINLDYGKQQHGAKPVAPVSEAGIGDVCGKK